MINILYKLNYLFHEIQQATSKGKLKRFFNSRIYINQVITPVEMDLTAPLDYVPFNLDDSFEFRELRLDNLQSNKWSISDPSGDSKVKFNLLKGYRWLTIITENTVIGDIWFVINNNDHAGNIHPDLKKLAIKCKYKEAYGFDMYIDPKYRGKNLAVPLQRYLQKKLKDEGILKVYGSYRDDNLPALWMHRMMKFHELPKRRVSRFFFFIQSKDLSTEDSSSPKTHNSSSGKSAKDEI